MPRPADGYFNAAGEPIPGTHDPVSRYKDCTALIYWAHKQGKAGVPLYDRTAINIGGCVHQMAELDLVDRPDAEILQCAHARLARQDDLAKAITCFNSYRAWRERNRVRPLDVERALVSETYQYGGTPDLIGVVNNRLALVDFKTAAKPYADNLVALAAHRWLWEENHPGQQVETCHLICLPKDGSGFQAHVWDAEQLDPHWRLFVNWLDGWRIERECEAAMREAALMTQEASPNHSAAFAAE
jgi:hypothetical protein